MWTFLGAIAAAVIAALVAIAKWVLGGRQQAAGVELGQAQQQASDAGAAASSEAKVAQSEANDASLTDKDVSDRLSKGNF